MRATHWLRSSCCVVMALLGLMSGAAGQERVPLFFGESRNCEASGSWLRVPARFEPDQTALIAMEGEDATSLSFYGDHRFVARDDASAGLAVAFLERLEWKFRVEKTGTYRTWYRVLFPFVANWSHSESMDGGDVRAHVEDEAKLEKDKWYWIRGHSYRLEAGSHSYAFHNWHGGILLDKVVLSPEESGYEPRGMGPQQKALYPRGDVWAITEPFRPLSLSAWKRIEYQRLTPWGRIGLEYTLDGKNFLSVGADGALDDVPVKKEPRIQFRITLGPDEEGRYPKLQNLSLVHRPGGKPHYVLENDRLRIEFWGREASLCGILNKVTRTTYSPTQGLTPLFRIGRRSEVAGGDGYKLEEYSPIRGTPIGLEIEDHKLLRFRYAFEEGEILVGGKVWLDESDIVRAQVEVTNKGAADVVSVAFPLLGDLAIGGDAENDYLITPERQGVRRKYPASEKFTYPRIFSWPGFMTMAWMELEDHERDSGLYLASYDRRATTTEFIFAPALDKSALTAGFRKYIRVRKGETWRSPIYVIGVHRGDWHWGADQYRSWARSWMMPPRVPRWFRESEGYVQGFPMHSGYFCQLPDGFVEGRDLGVKNMAVWAQMADRTGCCGLYPYPCPTMGTVEEFAWANRRLHRLGGHAEYYIGASLWNPTYTRQASWIGDTPIDFLPAQARALLPEDAHFFLENTVVDVNGRPQPVRNDETLVDAGSTQWQQYLVDWSLRYVREYDADGIYFDHLGAQVAWPSFNYAHHDDPGDWGRGQLNVLRTVKTEASRLNPDAILGIEAAGDVYQQYADWGLMSSTNFMQMYRYTFPQYICIGGGSSGGRDPEYIASRAFLFGYRLDVPWFKSYAPEGQEVMRLRLETNPFLFRARFVDTVGVKVTPEESGVEATLFVRAEENARGALINIYNPRAEEGAKIAVDLSRWGLKAPQAAWKMADDGFSVLDGSFQRGSYAFLAPVEKYSAALLVERHPPLVSVNDFPLSGAPGGAISGKIRLRNVSRRTLEAAVSFRLPSGYSQANKRLALGPGEEKMPGIAFRVAEDAKPGRADVECVVQAGPASTSWLIPFRVVQPLGATLQRTGKNALQLELHNLGPHSVNGTYRVQVYHCLESPATPVGLSPGEGEFTVERGAVGKIRIATSGMEALRSLQSLKATVRYADAKGQQYTAYAYTSIQAAIPNGGFERHIGGRPKWYWYWIRLRRGKAMPRVVDCVAHEGNRSLEMRPGEALESWSVKVLPHTRYAFSVWIMTETGTELNPVLVHLAHAGDPWSMDMNVGGEAEPGRWLKYQKSFTTGEGSGFCYFALYGPQKGKMWVDDIRLEIAE